MLVADEKRKRVYRYGHARRRYQAPFPRREGAGGDRMTMDSEGGVVLLEPR
jgi:hypothetical protein